jgi:nitroreductase
MTNSTIDHLLTRRSVSANSLGEPGPSEREIAQMLTAAARVPDHKKLVPWRFLLFQGKARSSASCSPKSARPRRRMRANSGSRRRQIASCARRL